MKKQLLKAELIINMHSRRSREVYQTVIDEAANAGIELTHIHKITKSVSFDDFIESLKKRKPAVVILAGGDGTISEGVDYFVGSATEIAVVPLGTTNNFARSLGLPTEIAACMQQIARSTAKKVDLGKIGDDYFTNVAGIGLSGEIAASIDNKTKRRFGRFAYAYVGFKKFFSHKAFFVRVTDAKSRLEVTFETHQLIVANGKYHAGKKIAAEAQLDNRELIIFALGGRSKLSFAYHMIDFYIGKRRSVRHSSYLTGNDVKILSETVKKIEVDGEVKYLTPAHISVAPKAILVRH